LLSSHVILYFYLQLGDGIEGFRLDDRVSSTQGSHSSLLFLVVGHPITLDDLEPTTLGMGETTHHQSL
jgi:hypothetical protein